MDAQAKSTARARAPRWRIVAAFAVAVTWTGVILFMDGLIARNAVSQAVAGMTYATTDGMLLRAALQTQRHGRTPRTVPDLCYEYTVAAQQYHGSRLYYGEENGPAEGVVYLARMYRAGQPVRVFYDPQNPAESALRVGIEPLTLWPTLMLALFNVVMVGVWPGVLRYRRSPRDRQSAAADLAIRTDGTRSVIRLSRYRPLGVFCWAVAFASMAGGFVVGLSEALSTGFAGVLGAWGLALALGFAAALRRWYVLRTGRLDLEVDCSTRELLLPGTWLRRSRRRIRFDEVESIVVEAKGPLPGEEPGLGRLWVVASHAGRGQRPVGEFLLIDDADAIAQRLRATLGLPDG